jgi:hypothetical protein
MFHPNQRSPHSPTKYALGKFCERFSLLGLCTNKGVQITFKYMSTKIEDLVGFLSKKMVGWEG